MDQIDDIPGGKTADGGQLQRRAEVGFQLLQMFFADDLGIFFSYIAALGGHSVDVAVLFQFVIGPFRGDNADAQILGQRADGGKQLAFGQFTRQDGGFDLAVNLLVNGPVVCVADNDVQKNHLSTVHEQYIQYMHVCQ